MPRLWPSHFPAESRPRARRAASVCALAAALAALPGCGGSPTGPDGELGAAPEAVSPVGGAQVSTDQPTFTVRNARGFDAGQAQYTFVVSSASGARELLSFTVPAGSGMTAATAPSRLPRGMRLSWTVTARSASGEASSARAQFRPPDIACPARPLPVYARSVVEWFLPACSLSRNAYNDPQQVLGPPDAGRVPGGGPFFGFMSLGEKGRVTVDMEACAADGPGPDVRVWQAVSAEPVTLYVGGSPEGPFVLIEASKPCGTRQTGVFSGYCDFDLATAEVERARYLRVEDGELFPCALGTTDSEGADLDAVQLLNVAP